MDNGIGSTDNPALDVGAEIITRASVFFMHLFQIYFKVLIGVGVVSLVVGFIFLIFGRGVIKALYFVGGLFVTSFVSMVIGAIIIYYQKVKPLFTNSSLLQGENPLSDMFDSFIILLSISLVLGLLIGILAAIFGKFGIVLVGLGSGMMIGLTIGFPTGNGIAIICLTLGFGIILAVLCGIYKRLFEVFTAAIVGGFLFANGYRFIFTGAVYLNLDRSEFLEKFPMIISISTLVIHIVVTLGFGIYHFLTYKREGSVEKNTSDPKKYPY
ncbi:hypothetical protein K502DRAFT_353851 [Neoconidiobolus thromboides FSU 785]|nr:hypothetical protein K502DRAFT_353851 [Neoconidiobolus thromboides FSU 785]